MEDYIVAFAESHLALWTTIEENNEKSIFESFAEFIIIYFPENKARAILSAMKDSNICEPNFLQIQVQILQHREGTSKNHISYWVHNSWTLRKIFERALEVLSYGKHSNTPTSRHLRRVTKEFINLTY